MPSFTASSLIKRIKKRIRRKGGSNQLVLWYPTRTAPAPLERPTLDCVLRTYRASDTQKWLELLNKNGELGEWNEARLAVEILPYMHGDNQLFCEIDGALIACAGIYDKTINHQTAWEIGWVAVAPEYQGRGLGKKIVHAALSRALELPARPIGLYTDPHRTKAVQLYIGLGLEPEKNVVNWR